MKLPTIKQNSDLQQAVDARELYQALGLDITQWARWSKQNIKENPFALKGTDYGVYDTMPNTLGGRPTTNYYLSVEFAKKLAMQVRTEMGERIRDYFLECERKASQPVFQVPQSYGEALQLAANQALQIEQDKKKVDHYNAIVNRDNLLNAKSVASKIGLTAQAMNKALTAMGVYDKRIVGAKVFNQKFISAGFGVMRQTSNGYTQAMFTLKGEAWIVDKLACKAIA